jgi:hypothetical protein
MLLNKKTIAKLGSEMNTGNGSKVSSFAMKQMEKMGWKEGQGLGKNESGIVKHIVAKKRDTNIGLGGNEEEVVNLPDNWWHDAFATNLSNMKNKMKGKKSSKKDRDKPIAAPPTYDELFKATGGARLGMRARADQKGKLKRTEDDQSHKLKGETVAVETVKDIANNENDIEVKKLSKKKRKIEAAPVEAADDSDRELKKASKKKSKKSSSD